MPLTVVDGGMLSATNAQYTMFKNRLINCEMSIDQRNAGAAISTAGGGYVVDRWQVQYGTGTLTLQQSTQAPAGFVNSIGITVTSAGTRLATDYFLLNQKIEGFNFSDLNFGSANAATVTLSFWVRSSVTGTYSGVLASGDNTRTYPFNYTISAANTWEQKSVTVAGDTSGGTTAYPITNGIGLFVKFDLGSGTNYELASAGSWQVATNKIGTTSQVGWAQTAGATFYVTGVQLEKGSTATAFDYRPYGTELSLCQRYYEILGGGVADISCTWYATAGAQTTGQTMFFKVTKRATPTVTKIGTWTVQNCGQPTAAGNVGIGSLNLYATSSAAGLVIYSTSSSSTYLTVDIEL